MGTYQDDRTWSDCYIPAIKSIVGPHLLVQSPDEIDREQAADLIVLTARGLTVACRVRRPGYAQQFGYEFTIRAARDNGIRTELAKIVDGWGDWLFYGHARDTDEPEIEHWMIVSLSSFRAHLMRRWNPGMALKCGNKSNRDGTWFKWFDVRSFRGRPPILVAASWTKMSGLAA